jgi:mono/diheme cytochrome c family protein
MRHRTLIALLVVAPILTAQFSTGAPGRNASGKPTWDPETAAFIRKGCVGCHKFTGTREAVGTQASDLTKVKTKLTKDQIRAVIYDPHALHPGANMPQLDMSTRDRELIVRFLTRTPTPRPTARPQASPTVMVFTGYRATPSRTRKKKRKRPR